jgi:RimJ/RimL family protein N-acetyltransferase
MEHFPKPLDRAESDELAGKIRASLAANRFGWWALEVPGVTPFAGFVGLFSPTFEAPFTPAVEVGWRLARSTWGQGFATEAARAALAYGFDVIRLDEIVSLTVPANTRSRRVMEKLGMTRSPADDFDHPRVPEGHPLRRHVLYRLKAPR